MLIKMRSFKFLISLMTISFFVFSSTFLIAAPAVAVAPAEIVPSPIISPPVRDNEPLSVNINYSIEFTLDIASGLEGSEIVLATDMEKVGADYWELLTPKYKISQGYMPGMKQMKFEALPGTPTFKLTGYIPEDYTTIMFQDPLSGTITLHKPGTLSMLSLSLGSGDMLENMIGTAIDDSIARCNILRSDKKKALDDNSDLAKVIDNLIETGHTERAITILATLPSEGWADSGSSSIIGYVVAGVLALIAVLAIIMLIRLRGTLSFLKLRLADHADQLDIVESRVSKLGERSLTSEISQIRDNLKDMGRR